MPDWLQSILNDGNKRDVEEHRYLQEREKELAYSEPEGQYQHNGDNMQELIYPDGANHFVTGFQWINYKVRPEQNSRCKQRGMGKEYKYSSVGRTMIEVDFPAFPFLHTHPGTLKSKITYEVAG